MISVGKSTDVTQPHLLRSKSPVWFWVLSIAIFGSPAERLLSQTGATSSRRVFDSRSQSTQVAATDIDQLVRQLGANDFASRKIAATKLKKIGAAAIEPLRRALSSTNENSDIEIRMQAERLLIEIQRKEFKQRIRDFLAAENNDGIDYGLPGWNAFAKIVGHQKAARRMYISMFGANEKLFRLHDKGENSFHQAFKVASTAGLRKRTNAGRKLDTLNCLMFLSSARAGANNENGSVAIPVNINLATRKQIAAQLNRPEMVTYVSSSNNRAEIESLIGYWLEQSFDDNLSFMNLRISIIENYRLADQNEFLVQVVLAREIPVQTRVRAIEALVPAIKAESVASLIPRLQTLLDDKSLVGRFPRPDGGQIQVVEFRDLALAACVILEKEDPIEFGFQFPPSSIPSLDRTLCGFANPQSRENAINKWRDLQSELLRRPDQNP